jgi:hypothetical protein
MKAPSLRKRSFLAILGYQDESTQRGRFPIVFFPQISERPLGFTCCELRRGRFLCNRIMSVMGMLRQL